MKRPRSKASKDDVEPPTGSGDDDRDLFRRAVADARPLDRSVLEPERPAVPARARFTRADEREVLDESLADDLAATEGGSGEHMSFHRASIGRRTLRKLARGKFSVQAECDLHGMTVPEAREALRDFVIRSADAGLNCVRVIHGKGLGSGNAGPVIKRKVDVWLRRWDEVLAFVSAKPVDGGTGAIYLLLRRH